MDTRPMQWPGVEVTSPLVRHNHYFLNDRHCITQGFCSAVTGFMIYEQTPEEGSSTYEKLNFKSTNQLVQIPEK